MNRGTTQGRPEPPWSSLAVPSAVEASQRAPDPLWEHPMPLHRLPQRCRAIMRCRASGAVWCSSVGCRATLGSLVVVGREEAHTCEPIPAWRRWPWGRSQEVKGGNTLARVQQNLGASISPNPTLITYQQPTGSTCSTCTLLVLRTPQPTPHLFCMSLSPIRSLLSPLRLQHSYSSIFKALALNQGQSVLELS